MEIYINNVVELLSLIVSIYYYPYLKCTSLRWFIPFLIFIFLGELFENYQKNILNESTLGVNYLIGIVESFFYGYMFYLLSNSKGLKMAIIVFIFFSVSGYCTFYFLDGKNPIYFMMNLIISGFLLTTIALVSLYMKFVEDENIILILQPIFWIVVGVSLFYSGISITFTLYDFIYKNNLSFFGKKLYHLVPEILSIVLYMCISVAIIICRQKNKI